MHIWLGSGLVIWKLSTMSLMCKAGMIDDRKRSSLLMSHVDP